MEGKKKEEEKMANFKMMEMMNTSFPVFSDQNMSSIFDDVVSAPFQPPCELGGGGGLEKSYMGFADMLGIQDLGTNNYSFFDLVHNPLSVPVPGAPPSLTTQHQHAPDPSSTSSTLLGESSEVVNTPATPNSISISSSSSEAAIDDQQQQQGKEEMEDQNPEEDDDKSKKHLKAKKKNQKRLKEPRFAFMTKSEIDQLDDGFRWRKYGQKAVKNSPFPRSYYRCTTAACGVKKRVERSYDDPSIVMTTYEGQHTHPCPVMTRGILGFGFATGVGTGSRFLSPSPDQCSTVPVQSPFGGNGSASSSLLLHHPQNNYFPYQLQQQFSSYLLNPSNTPTITTTTTTTTNSLQKSNPITQSFQQRHIRPPCLTVANSRFSCSGSSSGLHQVRDDGLLQDIVPSQMRHEPTKEE